MANKRKKYGELYYTYNTSLTKLIKDKFFDLKPVAESTKGEPKIAVPIPPDGLELFNFAVIVDGKVVDIIKVNSYLSNILNQDFKMVEFNPYVAPVNRGWVYEDGEFKSE